MAVSLLAASCAGDSEELAELKDQVPALEEKLEEATTTVAPTTSATTTSTTSAPATTATTTTTQPPATTTTTTTTVDCGMSETLYKGCYSAGSDSTAVWDGACSLDSVATGEYVHLYFKATAKCSFSSVRAKGDVGENWRKLGTDSLINWTGDEFAIQHTNENVHMIRLCSTGLDDAVAGKPCR